MSSFTKTHAKNDVERFTSLLQDRMLITDINKVLVRGNIEYHFETCGINSLPTPVRCKDIKELALALSCLWEGYSRAREAYGLDTFFEEEIY